MKEYKEIIRHACGHTREVVSLGKRLPGRQAKQMRNTLCPTCQLKQLLQCEMEAKL